MCTVNENLNEKVPVFSKTHENMQFIYNSNEANTCEKGDSPCIKEDAKKLMLDKKNMHTN